MGELRRKKMSKTRMKWITIVFSVLIVIQVGIIPARSSAVIFQNTCDSGGCSWICETECPVDFPEEGFCDEYWYTHGPSMDCEIGSCYFTCEGGSETWVACCEYEH